MSALPGQPLIIKDIGPWDQCLTVTNDAEDVVKRLVVVGLLPEGRRLFCIDSEGDTGELLVSDGRFAGFRDGGPDDAE